MILSILDINFYKKQMKYYFVVSFFVLIFSVGYSFFSHGVYSFCFIFSFIIPLIGALVSYLIYKRSLNKYINRWSVNFFNAFVATITVYCIMNGIFFIYGVSVSLIKIYLYVSLFWLVVSLILEFIHLRK